MRDLVANKRVVGLWLILLLAFLLRLIGSNFWQQQAIAEGKLFRLGDSEGYWVLAGHIARGEAYQYGSENASVFRAPLFPIVLAPFASLENAPRAIYYARLLGALLGTVAVWELWLLAKRLGGSSAANWAGIIAAISPAAIGMSVMILSEMLLVPLMLGHLLAWQKACSAAAQRHVIGWSMVAGMMAGLAILARPSWLLFAPFLMTVGLLLGPSRGRHLKIGVMTLVAMSVVMSPWWYRNALVTGKFVPTTLQVGPSLYDGLHPGATGASDEGMAFMQAIVAEQIALNERANPPHDGTLEYRINRRAQHLALEFARSQPVEVLRLAIAKFARTWSLWPDGGELGSTAIRLLISLSTFSVLLLALLGSWGRNVRDTWWIAVCWMPCLYFTLLHMVFVGSIRYREPAVFVLAALAGCAITDLTHRLAGRIRPTYSVPGEHVPASEPSQST